MNPSDEKKNHPSTASAAKSKFLSRIIIFLLIVVICGALLYFSQGPKTPEPDLSQPFETTIKTQIFPQEDPEASTNTADSGENTTITAEKQTNGPGHSDTLQETAAPNLPETTAIPVDTPGTEEIIICAQPTQQLNSFYKHLDTQSYMATYELTTPSQKHFTALVKKLLANPPQVARESDDLYSILKNTAHFFRISGKDNIFMMKGILDHEKGRLEQILADYYLLVTTPDCDQSPYASGIDNAALYEYACFFLNTMGGRLYLFRRDSQSRMVVTYYAILLIDQANRHQNNRHGISLKPSVDMLIAEMESGGSALKKLEVYLDTLYDLKERYQ